MKKISDIYYQFVGVAKDYKMLDTLSQAEIDELAMISEDPLLCALVRRQNAVRENMRTGNFVPQSYNQMLRQTFIMQAVALDNLTQKCTQFRVRTIVGGWSKTLQDRLEFNINAPCQVLVQLIRMFPNWSRFELARYYVDNKLCAFDDPARDGDPVYIAEMLKYIQEYMKPPFNRGIAPVSERERIFAARWIEIYQRNK